MSAAAGPDGLLAPPKVYRMTSDCKRAKPGTVHLAHIKVPYTFNLSDVCRKMLALVMSETAHTLQAPCDSGACAGVP